MSNTIDSRFIDVVMAPNGYPARGCTPKTSSCGLAPFEEVFSARMRDYPRSDWDDLLLNNKSLETLVPWTHDQQREGTCASNAIMGCAETAMGMMLGKKNTIMLSPIGVYRWIASGPNSGSNVLANVRQMQTVGTLPVDTPENRARLKLMGLPENHVLQHTGYYQKFPDNWKSTAAYFQIEEAYEATTFEGCMCGLFDDFVLQYGRSGHSIFGVTGVKQTNTYYVKYGNSWGKWGEVGENGLQMFGYDSESFLRNAIRSYGAALIRSVKLTDELLKSIGEL